MTKLDCNVVNCSYNADNCCRRTDIQVEGTQAKTSSETCCGSFCTERKWMSVLSYNRCQKRYNRQL